jgi:hypothetical protein
VRIGLFVTCLGDTLFPEAPRATVAVLERLGHEVAFPREQTCCGQLHQNSGYRDEAHALAERFARIFDEFEAVVSPSSSCVGAVRELSPDLAAVGELDASALIVTAVADPAQEYDFVSRLFAPSVGIPEDPVTGSSHTVLAPFWAGRLGRTALLGLQASPRSGLVRVEANGDRVTVMGRAITVFDGALSSAANPG